MSDTRDDGNVCYCNHCSYKSLHKATMERHCSTKHPEPVRLPAVDATTGAPTLDDADDRDDDGVLFAARCADCGHDRGNHWTDKGHHAVPCALWDCKCANFVLAASPVVDASEQLKDLELDERASAAAPATGALSGDEAEQR